MVIKEFFIDSFFDLCIYFILLHKKFFFIPSLVPLWSMGDRIPHEQQAPHQHS